MRTLERKLELRAQRLLIKQHISLLMQCCDNRLSKILLHNEYIAYYLQYMQYGPRLRLEYSTLIRVISSNSDVSYSYLWYYYFS